MDIAQVVGISMILGILIGTIIVGILERKDIKKRGLFNWLSDKKIENE